VAPANKPRKELVGEVLTLHARLARLERLLSAHKPTDGRSCQDDTYSSRRIEGICEALAILGLDELGATVSVL